MVLPGLILLFDGLLYRTAKKSPHIPTGGVAAVSYRFRRPLVLLFVGLLVGSYLLQTLTPISFGMEPPSQIAEVFPKSNPVVILYDNADSGQLQTLTERLEADPNVTAAVSYPTTLGCSYSAEELAEAVEEMAPDTEFDLDSSMLRLLYYHCYMDGEAPSVTLSALLRFLADDVVTSDTFADQLDETVAQQAETLRSLADGEALTLPMTAEKLAALLQGFGTDIEQNTMELLCLFYGSQKEYDETWTRWRQPATKPWSMAAI